MVSIASQGKLEVDLGGLKSNKGRHIDKIKNFKN